ncbi:hypothetical protein [Afipia broomeae]|uniref:Uncharacterized protein n=1 Tax=Afipia broomeae ATCC 49717 TaxID=883078 RepID=K8P196_9BRAD|nr:hypothetical protein [Afipia broomeae]EKS34514.1 hypothetical protein HMPREF9695_04424 [Afipia broomeae ATCC 49717]
MNQHNPQTSNAATAPTDALGAGRGLASPAAGGEPAELPAGEALEASRIARLVAVQSAILASFPSRPTLALSFPRVSRTSHPLKLFGRRPRDAVAGASRGDVATGGPGDASPDANGPAKPIVPHRLRRAVRANRPVSSLTPDEVAALMRHFRTGDAR